MKNKNKPKNIKGRMKGNNRNKGFSPMQILQAKQVAKDEVRRMRRDVFATTLGIVVNVLTSEEYYGNEKGKVRAIMEETEILYKNWEDGYVDSMDLMEHIQMTLGKSAITRWSKMFNIKDKVPAPRRKLSPIRREYADATLMKKTKKELLAYIRCLENSMTSLEERAESQSKLLMEYYVDGCGKDEI